MYRLSLLRPTADVTCTPERAELIFPPQHRTALTSPPPRNPHATLTQHGRTLRMPCLFLSDTFSILIADVISMYRSSSTFTVQTLYAIPCVLSLNLMQSWLHHNAKIGCIMIHFCICRHPSHYHLSIRNTGNVAWEIYCRLNKWSNLCKDQKRK